MKGITVNTQQAALDTAYAWQSRMPDKRFTVPAPGTMGPYEARNEYRIVYDDIVVVYNPVLDRHAVLVPDAMAAYVPEAVTFPATWALITGVTLTLGGLVVGLVQNVIGDLR